MNISAASARISITKTIKGLSLFISVSLILAGIAAMIRFDGYDKTVEGLHLIFFSPCPLVTDYFVLGCVSATFINAGLCGLAFFLFMHFLKASCAASTLAGFFLVIAHGFYGLNFINMWPPVLSIVLFCRASKVRFRDNLDMAMFATAFGPFFSELFFRYTLGRTFLILKYTFSGPGPVLAVLMVLFLALAIPAMLPGALKLHKGYNLYNGGLAFGLLGMFLYSVMYKTFGLTQVQTVANISYKSGLPTHGIFVNEYYLILFGVILFAGWWLNGRSFRGYGALLKDTGHQTNFFTKYSPSLVLINLGLYGLMMLLYFDLAIYFTEGDAYTGATTGIILAAMTFCAAGQHPRNVWPILAGYVLLSVIVHLVSYAYGLEVPWTVSTQAYMNAAAFATGLCPLAGRYGKRVGILAGMVSACICTTTSAMHGGFVLYNGGLTAGITALILVPCLEYHSTFRLRG